MPKIIIKEIDDTLPQVNTGITDVVFVPGFTGMIGVEKKETDNGQLVINNYYYEPTSDLGLDGDVKIYQYTGDNNWIELDPQPLLYKRKSGDDAYAVYITNPATPYNTPTLCRTLTEFEFYFGDTPWIWPNIQTIPGNTIDKSSCFSDAALPNNRTFYNINDYEKSYIYAKELLELDIPVLYYAYADIEEGSALVTGLKDTKDIEKELEILTADIIGNKPIEVDITELIDKTGKSDVDVAAPAPSDFRVESTNKDTRVTYTCSNVTYDEKNNKLMLTLTVGYQAPEGESAGSDPLNDSITVIGSVAYTYNQNAVPTTIKDFSVFEDNNGNSAGIYSELCNGDIWSLLEDKGMYEVKYLTSGVYPSFEYTDVTTKKDFAKRMISTASSRGDCVAVIDHTNKPERSLAPNDPNSVFGVMQNSALSESGTYGCMFTPWATYSTKDFGNMIFPASFGYLKSLGQSIKTSNNWLAIAGVTRGLIPGILNINTNKQLTNAIADSYQSSSGISINPITNINSYGYTLWGNRTLKKNINALTATSFLNIRNMVSDIKKLCYRTAVELMFEHNTDVLWANFKAKITPTLDQLRTGYGVEAYDIKKITSKQLGKLEAQIIIYPVYAVEEFEITVTMTNTSVTVE